MPSTRTPEQIREAVRALEVAAGDLDMLRAVSGAQTWLSENPSPEDDSDGTSIRWVVAFCDQAIEMIDSAFGAGTVDELFAGSRKTASGLLVAIDEISVVVRAANSQADALLGDLTTTVAED